MLIFRELNSYFRMRFIVDVDNDVCIRLENSSEINSFPELLNDGADEELAIDNIVAFADWAVNSNRNISQCFPICSWIRGDLFERITARICREFSAVPLRIAFNDFSLVVGEMVVVGRVNNIPVNDDSIDDDEGPTYHEIELWAYPQEFRSVGYLE